MIYARITVFRFLPARRKDNESEHRLVDLSEYSLPAVLIWKPHHQSRRARYTPSLSNYPSAPAPYQHYQANDFS